MGVLGPVLYTLFTADMPVSEDLNVATYSDDTAFIATSDDPSEASRLLLTHLNLLKHWLHKWKIKVNAQKATHNTFTIRRASCPKAAPWDPS